MPRYLQLSAEWPEWDALVNVHELCRADPRFPAFELDEFMNMGRHPHRTCPTIHLYKHIDTRRYLNVDVHGHAYAYVYQPPAVRRGVLYEPLPDLVTAVRHVFQPFEEINLYRSYPPAGWVHPCDAA